MTAPTTLCETPGPCRCGREACYMRPLSQLGFVVSLARSSTQNARRLDRLARENPHRSDYTSDARTRRRDAKSHMRLAWHLRQRGWPDDYEGVRETRITAAHVGRNAEPLTAAGNDLLLVQIRPAALTTIVAAGNEGVGT